jgi:hypothetical protein
MAAERSPLREPLTGRADDHHRISVSDNEDRKSRGSRGSTTVNKFERGSLLRASFRASSLASRPSLGGKGGAAVTDPSRESADLEASLVGLTSDAANKARSVWGRNEIPEVSFPKLSCIPFNALAVWSTVFEGFLWCQEIPRNPKT